MKRTLRTLAGAPRHLDAHSPPLRNARCCSESSQAAPVEPRRCATETLNGLRAGGFQPQEPGPFITRIEAEIAAGSGAIGVVGGLHGDLSRYADNWVDLSDVDLAGITVSPAFLELGKLGTAEQKYLPWMQATYVMAANKQALEYLPEGADLNALTYDQVMPGQGHGRAPVREIRFRPAEGLGTASSGFLLPACRLGSHQVPLRRAEAWNKFKELAVHQPGLDSYDFMQEPLLTGDGRSLRSHCPPGRSLQPSRRFRRLPGFRPKSTLSCQSAGMAIPECTRRRCRRPGQVHDAA
jgi:multiple sugar transport system substrate-binding protein